MMCRNVLVSSTASVVNGSPYLSLPDMKWDILLPVGEGTVMLGNLVLPSILEHSLDILKWVETSSLNVEMFL